MHFRYNWDTDARVPPPPPPPILDTVVLHAYRSMHDAYSSEEDMSWVGEPINYFNLDNQLVSIRMYIVLEAKFHIPVYDVFDGSNCSKLR